MIIPRRNCIFVLSFSLLWSNLHDVKFLSETFSAFHILRKKCGLFGAFSATLRSRTLYTSSLLDQEIYDFMIQSNSLLTFSYKQKACPCREIFTCTSLILGEEQSSTGISYGYTKRRSTLMKGDRRGKETVRCRVSLQPFQVSG